MTEVSVARPPDGSDFTQLGHPPVLTRQEVEIIVREEIAAYEQRRQAACGHRTAWLGEDGVTRCEQCGKAFS